MDLFLCGHTHDYERGAKNGVTHIITGGGGSALDSFQQDFDFIEVYESRYHFTFLSFAGDTLTIEAVEPGGTVFDEHLSDALIKEVRTIAAAYSVQRAVHVCIYWKKAQSRRAQALYIEKRTKIVTTNSGDDRKPVKEIQSRSVRMGDVIDGRYEIIDIIGKGGMGAVYEARELGLEVPRTVALKVLLPNAADSDEKVSKRFEQEIRIVTRMDHPHIVPIYNVGRHQGMPYFVMKYVRGRTLRDYLSRRGQHAGESIIRRIGGQVADALAHIHKAGAIHRDIKSNNVMVDDGANATLMDFGIAKTDDATTVLTATGEVLGTGPYLSPEQWRGKLDERSDIYALGVMLYEMAVGELPFMAETIPDLMNRILTKPEKPIRKCRRDLSKDLCDVIHKCMAKDPDNRFQTMWEVRNALQSGSSAFADDAHSGDSKSESKLKAAQKAHQDGEVTSALKRLEKVKKDKPNDPHIAQLEEEYSRLAAEEEIAVKQIREMVDHHEHAEAKRIAGEFLRKFHSRRIQTDLERIQAFLDKTEELLAEAEMLRVKKKLDLAKPVYERVLTRDPNNETALKAMEKLGGVQGRQAPAASTSRARRLPGMLAKLVAVLIVAWFLMPVISKPIAADLHEKLGDVALSAGLLTGPPYLNAYDSYARAIKYLGEKKDSSSVAAKQDKIVDSILEKGDQLAKNKSYQLALDEYKKAAALRPDDKIIAKKIEKTMKKSENAAE